jgi:hypothetical protein
VLTAFILHPVKALNGSNNNLVESTLVILENWFGKPKRPDSQDVFNLPFSIKIAMHFG